MQNGKKIDLILPEHCHGHIDNVYLQLDLYKKHCHKVLGYSFCKPRNPQAWREERLGMPRDGNGTGTFSSLFSSPRGCPVLAEIIEIITHPFILFPFWDNIEFTLLTHQLGRPCNQSLYSLFNLSTASQESLIQRVVGRRGQQQHPNHP